MAPNNRAGVRVTSDDAQALSAKAVRGGGGGSHAVGEVAREADEVESDDDERGIVSTDHIARAEGENASVKRKGGFERGDGVGRAVARGKAAEPDAVDGGDVDAREADKPGEVRGTRFGGEGMGREPTES